MQGNTHPPKNPINPKFPVLWHGADYNPEQWPESIWTEDMRLMDIAHVNVATIGVFSWVSYEPQEGVYDFAWLDRIFEMQHQRGGFVLLATPSAAMPAWMSSKYPEILRTGPDRVQRKHSDRVNYCWTSPVYREKTREIARQLAERYGNHPALAMWHVSNEYGGECYCPLCEQAFRDWLYHRYEGSLDKLNTAFWARFWSHTYTDWSQITIPGEPHGETSVLAMRLDWDRFVSDQIIDFYKNESAPLREVSPNVPITTNMMGVYPIIDYQKLVQHVDIASWDSYPFFCDQVPTVDSYVSVAMTHDIYRAMKLGKPFMMIESTPSSSNWYPTNALKRPGMHRVEELQAIAHGSDTAMYFQWRQSRGSTEMYHGAVVTHAGASGIRVFEEVAELGRELTEIQEVAGTTAQAEVALIYDWENEWALSIAEMPKRGNAGYFVTCRSFYEPFWSLGVTVDVVDQTRDLSGYKLVVVPMGFMLRPGFADRLKAFVKQGGTLITSYKTGYVDESMLAFEGGAPGPLRDVLGLNVEEIDGLYDEQFVKIASSGAQGLASSHRAYDMCELINVSSATSAAEYASEFYAGRPAVTYNRYGKGQAIHVAARTEPSLQRNLVKHWVTELGLRRTLNAELPYGVTAQRREADGIEYVFVMNFSSETVKIDLNDDGLRSRENRDKSLKQIELKPNDVQVLVRDRSKASVGV